MNSSRFTGRRRTLAAVFVAAAVIGAGAVTATAVTSPSSGQPAPGPAASSTHHQRHGADDRGVDDHGRHSGTDDDSRTGSDDSRTAPATRAVPGGAVEDRPHADDHPTAHHSRSGDRSPEARHHADDPAGDDHGGVRGHGADDPAGDDHHGRGSHGGGDDH
ncbi:hypothetical protein PV336_12210 [Streptomyces sp. MI02-2A]|uniref:hypothetical protein n=1 Tax=unclassified Streptomyces TaxID=2593676 RepID=UPI000740E000|nr:MULTISPECIES: hypothetical protein [unclassified Streptomyces]KUJ38929.1 hypothetical protein ADL25_22070 [Streptomyces sp. NRRL F-5122]MDX3259982.1 hypothetical protein [Streptomyces sp. MI02-2A]REE64241.1 hypothetical protein BX257_6914 [Streptomyces sp. 3212.3]